MGRSPCCVEELKSAYPRQGPALEELESDLGGELQRRASEIPASSAARAAASLVVVWDLDDCLIRSERTHPERLEEDPALNTTVLSRVGRNREITHVDDDLMKFRTVARPWSKVVLRAIQAIGTVKQFVFTSASRGYMQNVVSLLEHDGSGIFEPSPRLSCTDFGLSELARGKDLKNLGC